MKRLSLLFFVLFSFFYGKIRADNFVDVLSQLYDPKNELMEKHVPIINYFSFIDHENGKIEVSGNIIIFRGVLPFEQSHLIDHNQFLRAKNKVNISRMQEKEDRVERITLLNQKGNHLLDKSFMIDGKRKKIGEKYRLNGPFSFVVDTATEFKEMTIFPIAFSVEQGEILGPKYNLKFEYEVFKLKQKAMDMDKIIKYNPDSEKVMSPLQKKHVPVFTFEKEDIHVDFSHPKVKEEDPDHFIKAIYALDELGRVVLFKELDLASHPFTSVSESMDVFAFARTYLTLTPYEFCSKDGLFQGPMVAVPADIKQKQKEDL